MSDRKYRQHGYQDDDRDRRPRGEGPPGGDRRPEREPGAPAGTRRMSSEGAKNPRMMGYRQVAKCARCGAPVDPEILTLSKCEKCSTDLHACVQCVNFDPSARFECSETDSRRGSRPRTSPTSAPSSPRARASSAKPAPPRRRPRRPAPRTARPNRPRARRRRSTTCSTSRRLGARRLAARDSTLSRFACSQTRQRDGSQRDTSFLAASR